MDIENDLRYHEYACSHSNANGLIFIIKNVQFNFTLTINVQFNNNNKYAHTDNIFIVGCLVWTIMEFYYGNKEKMLVTNSAAILWYKYPASTRRNSYSSVAQWLQYFSVTCRLHFGCFSVIGILKILRRYFRSYNGVIAVPFFSGS